MDWETTIRASRSHFHYRNRTGKKQKKNQTQYRVKRGSGKSVLIGSLINLSLASSSFGGRVREQTFLLAGIPPPWNERMQAHRMEPRPSPQRFSRSGGSMGARRV